METLAFFALPGVALIAFALLLGNKLTVKARTKDGSEVTVEISRQQPSPLPSSAPDSH